MYIIIKISRYYNIGISSYACSTGNCNQILIRSILNSSEWNTWIWLFNDALFYYYLQNYLI